MIVPSSKLLGFLPENQPVELRQPNYQLANPYLPHQEAYSLICQGAVEGKVIGSKLRYLRLLTPEEAALRKKLESPVVKNSQNSPETSSDMITHTRMGAFREPLRQVSVTSDTFGNRTVSAEGDFSYKCWSHCGLSL